MDAPKKDRRKSLLAEKIEPFKFPFDATSWQSFEALRAAKNQKKRAFIRKTGKYTSIFIVLTGLSFWLFQNKTSQSSVTLLSENNLNSKADPSVYDTNLNKKRTSNGAKLKNVESINSNQSALINSNQSALINSNQSALINSNQSALINSNQSVLINSNQNELINSNQNELIIGKIEKSHPSVSDTFFNKKTLLGNNLVTKNNTTFNDVVNKISDDLLIKNAENSIELNTLDRNDLALNNAANNAANNVIINGENNKETLNDNELGPLSIKPFLDTISSSANTFLPIIPQFKSSLLTVSPQNEVMIGYGKSSIYAGRWKQSVFSAIYLRRFTPLMAAGLNTTYSQGNENTHAFSADAQLNFTLFHRPRLGLYLTTGYGYRIWRLFETRLAGSTETGQSNGIALGLDARYSPIKNYFVACRLEMKETSYSNLTFLIQIGKLF